MSISETINVNNLGSVSTKQGAAAVISYSPTGTLGLIPESNPDSMPEVGYYSTVVNIPCRAYKDSLNSATIQFATRRSFFYSTVTQGAFAIVSRESELDDIQGNQAVNGLQVNDFCTFIQDDPTSDYEEGDVALFNGNGWTRYPAGDDGYIRPVTPTNPINTQDVRIQGQNIGNAAYPTTVGLWNTMNRTEAEYEYTIGTSNFISLDVTDVVKEITERPDFERNNTINLIFDVVDTGTNYLFDMGVQPTYWNFTVNYNPVEPFAVQNIQVTDDYLALDVTWEPPLDDGGSPIIGYDYQYKPEGETDWIETQGSNDTYARIENLDPQLYYFIRVRAANAIGYGPWTTTSIPYSPNNNSPLPIGSLDFNSANPIRVRIRRDYSAAWDAADPVLAIGEPGYILDTNFMKVGDGLTSWTGLGYVQVPDSTINFPAPPDVFLGIKDDRFSSAPIFTCNLSDNIPLVIEAGTGMHIDYDALSKAMTFSLDRTFDPITSGTVANPQASGSAGELRYDDERIFICVQDNIWKRVLQDQPWFNIVPLAVSNSAGQYPSNTNILSGGSTIQVVSNGDPYPAKAGTPLVNDGLTPRGGFLGGYIPGNQDYNFVILYKGGESSSNPQPVAERPIGVTVNGVVIKPSTYSGDIDAFSPPANFEYDMPFWKNYFGIDDCNGLVQDDLAYTYYGGGFVSYCWNTPKFYEANSYYNDTEFGGDHMRHPDGHSKIVGIAFDGYPIYGPMGYTDPLDVASAIKRMESSYRKKTTDSHRPTNYKYTAEYVIDDVAYPLVAGAFIQDYEYNSSFGDLDEYNGRYCKTPDYPNGTYAYFLTFSDDNLQYPAYPYIIGTSTREQRSVL